ncbi:hypothetical protein NRY68_16510 [Acidithiobacillus ferrooxidans]|uniref:hypothetical protein n=1 Tax=Acidithiobacillus ferrooxidans TaxID=920 RepID=UPI00214912CB|nr:hypothetical protein [Acidithiobacillus ferrooxidans]MCR1347353.1 hypothetical protein [Acidithiobacillus ferrooxidans]MCR1354786.1 hypothetical protein [Acidithiobacillus ferrooxidans]
MTTLPCPEPLAPFAEVVEAVALWYRHFLAMQPNDYHGRRWAERMVESTLVMLYQRWDRREILAEGIRQGCVPAGGCARQDYSRQANSPQEMYSPQADNWQTCSRQPCSRQTTRQSARVPAKSTTGNGVSQHPGGQMNLL